MRNIYLRQARVRRRLASMRRSVVGISTGSSTRVRLHPPDTGHHHEDGNTGATRGGSLAAAWDMWEHHWRCEGA
jgi:hypothetical protein